MQFVVPLSLSSQGQGSLCAVWVRDGKTPAGLYLLEQRRVGHGMKEAGLTDRIETSCPPAWWAFLMSYHHFTILIIVSSAEYFTVIALGFYRIESFSGRGAFRWGLTLYSALVGGIWAEDWPHVWVALVSDVKFTSLYVTLSPFLIYFLTLNSVKTPEILSLSRNIMSKIGWHYIKSTSLEEKPLYKLKIVILKCQ